MATGWIRARAPATIANLGPGFDVFALAIRGLADEVAVRPAEHDSLRVQGVDAADLPSTFSSNTAGIVIEALGSREPVLLSRISVNPRIGLAVAIPRFVLRTADMRGILPSVVPLRDAVSNVGHAAILTLALARGDSALAGRCLEDRFAEPVRAPSLPG